ncbi:hypothetical protein [Micromonospora sp. NBC_01813]|uniref:hypothetical protein n=1 Tax=Micromonospora sp. NBC_01813 TaxID=2975988 RepID=UPI002DDB3EE6|nr:hypothetical protein [Micromonospora sp. NBC_01813]WSA11584.1 hypothetical protein OG958_12815 [Micromonospora sp. NBC_01813]
MTTVAKEAKTAAADWSFMDVPETVAAVRQAARIVSARYRERAVNMLAEYDDLLQDGLLLVATKDRLRNLDPRLLTFRLIQELNGTAKYGAPKARSTVYLSELENE